MNIFARMRSRIGDAWANQSLAIKGLVVVALPLTILIAALVLLFFASAEEIRAEGDVRSAFSIQRDTNEVHALLAEAANGVRGYLLTGQERFLDPYVRAEAELPETLARLDASIRDPEVRARFERVVTLAAQKREGLAQLRAMASEQAPSSISRQTILAALSANKVVLDGLRTEIAEMQRLEGRLLQARLDRVDEARARNALLTAASAILGLLSSLIAVYLFSIGIVRRVKMLGANAERLQRGEELAEVPGDADELGRLAAKLQHASSLLRAREQALRESEERFRLVVEGVRDYGIFALSAEGHVVSWNAGAERIKGWCAEEILGRHFSTFYPPETREVVPSLILQRAIADGCAEDEGWRIRKDGSRFWANVVVTALRNEACELRGFAKVTRDMTERKRVEEALSSAREEAIAANVAKTEFLSRTSHELRTPMSSILGFAQVLELDERELKPTHRTAVEQILKAGRHLLALINEILDISSIESGGGDLTLSAQDIRLALIEAKEIAAPIAQAAGLSLTCELPTSPIIVRCDPRRVTQIALNLFSNGIKYGASGHEVGLNCKVLGHVVRVEVLDEGIGVDEAEASRLFSPFDRLGKERSSGVDGTGLGLAVSKSLVEAMGGAIGYRRRIAPQSGSVFWFELPLAKGSDQVESHEVSGHV